jgi:hypothetical protein
MKRIVLVVLCALSLNTVAQTDEVIDLLKSIEKEWEWNSGSVVIQKVIEDTTKKKQDFYMNIKEYFVNNYRNANAVLQLDDKDGGIIIGKGTYGDIMCTEVFMGSSCKYTFWHTIKCEMKDGRVRVTISIDRYETYVSGTSSTVPRRIESLISDLYPINTSSKWKKRDGYIFYRAVNKALVSILSIQESIKKQVQKDTDW